MSLRDSLVHSHFVDPTRKQNVTKGTFLCGSCEALDTRMQVTLPGDVKWSQKYCVNCGTMGVIYFFQCCLCDAYYVGKTSRPFHLRIQEHTTAARSGFFRTAVGRHVALTHNYDYQGLKFLPLMVIPPPDRGGDWDQALLRAKALWIFRLRADRPPGLNDSISYAPFL